MHALPRWRTGQWLYVSETGLVPKADDGQGERDNAHFPHTDG